MSSFMVLLMELYVEVPQAGESSMEHTVGQPKLTTIDDRHIVVLS